jgi:PAS domain S-box-containing protein
MTEHLHRFISSRNGSPQNGNQGIPKADVQEAAGASRLARSSDLVLEIQALQILESSDDCIKVLDLEGRILFMSRGGQALLGIQDITPFLHTSWVEFWQGTDQQAAIEAIAKARSGKVHTFQGYCPTLSGEPKWWDSKVSPIRGAKGQVEQLLCISRDITERRQIEEERKRAEEKLRQSEARYRAIVNQAVTGVACTDLNGKLTLVNQKYCTITGYSADELRQLRMQDITHPEDLPLNVELFKRMQAEDRPFEIEKRYVRKDGSIVWVSNSVYIIRDRYGKPQSVVAIVLDITERKQAEAALREAQESLTIAVEAAQMGTWHLDLTKDVSPRRSLRHDQIFGYDTPQTEWGHEIAKRHVLEEDHKIVDAAFAHALETGELNFDARIQWSDGSIHWMAARGRFYFDENGNPTHAAGVNFDITASKQIEARLRESEARYRSLFNSIDEGFCLIEVLFDETGEGYDYRFLEANPAFEKHTGLVDAIGKTVREVVPQHEPFWFRIYGKIARTGVPARFENFAEGLGRFYDVYAFRVGEPHEHKVAVLFNDISERKRVEDERRRAEAEREQLLANEQQARAIAEALREEAQTANRVKDEFLAVLSHELRSPLNPILGWSTILLNGELDAAKTTQALTTIQRNAKLQSELIEDLLDVSRILRGKLSLNIAPVDLAFTIQAAMETVRLAAEAKSISVEANLPTDIGLVSGDSTRLQQVIWNLLSNAVKFTPEGGRIEIQLKYVDSSAEITVSDTGQGIEPDFLPYVFDYFRQANATTTRKFGGLGLGLAIVRQLVELHGGTVRVESPGERQGATFVVRFPLMPTAAPTKQEERSPQLFLNWKGMKILVVDDEADTRELVAFVLEQQGAEVITATSAHEALLILPQTKPDVLLSDIGMPDMDGYTLIRQIRALAPEQGGNILAIALTAYAGDTNQQQVIAAGFQKHISKPIDPEVLVQAIAHFVQPH